MHGGPLPANSVVGISSGAFGVTDVLELAIPLLELVDGLSAKVCFIAHHTDAIPSLLVSDSATNSDIPVIDHARVTAFLEILVLFDPLLVLDSLVREEVLNVEEPALWVVRIVEII